jgi:tetratricopeptide (TPR) repeat protein
MKTIFISLLLLFSLEATIFADAITDSYIFESKKDYAKAIEVLEAASKETPGDYFLQLRMGWLALIKGEYSKSSGYYQKATLLAPNAIEPRIGNVRALLALGLYKQADVACRTILKQDSKNYFARSTIAYSNYVLANYQESEKYYASIIVDYPADTEMLIGLGWSQLKLLKKEKAKPIFTLLKKILPYEERVTSGYEFANK